MQIQENISLKPYNTFGIDVIAQYFSPFTTLDALAELLQSKPAKTHGQLLLLGGGSNLLLTKNVEGLVLKNELKGIALVNETEDHYYIKVGAGEVWHEFVQYCIRHNYAGIENLSLIPGSVGASPMQNIGAYGVEIKDVFEELEALHIKSNRKQVFKLNDCAFGYRESVFKTKYKNEFIILNVIYRLRKQPVFNTSYGAIEQELERMGVKDLSIQSISQAVINIRSSKLPDPKEIGNAGSFFKNPTVSKFRWHIILEEHRDLVAYKVDDFHYKIAAGWLIEKCGWKGYRKGDAGCHAKQALVLVNYGQAKGSEILELANQVIESVQKKFGILLEKEVNII